MRVDTHPADSWKTALVREGGRWCVAAQPAIQYLLGWLGLGRRPWPWSWSFTRRGVVENSHSGDRASLQASTMTAVREALGGLGRPTGQGCFFFRRGRPGQARRARSSTGRYQRASRGSAKPMPLGTRSAWLGWVPGCVADEGMDGGMRRAQYTVGSN